MKAILIAIFLLGILGTIASAATDKRPIGTSESAWPDQNSPIPPYDK